MLHPNGTNDRILTKSYSELRERGKEKHGCLSNEKWDFSQLEFPDGRGATRTCTFEVFNRMKSKLIDIRKRSECGD